MAHKIDKVQNNKVEKFSEIEEVKLKKLLKKLLDKFRKVGK